MSPQALPSGFLYLLVERLHEEDCEMQKVDGRGLAQRISPLTPERHEQLLESLTGLLDACFFASLQTEEGTGARFALRIGGRNESFLFEDPIGITPQSLAKLSAMSASTPHPETLLLARHSLGEWSVYGVACTSMAVPHRGHDATDQYFIDIVSNAPGALRVYGGGRPLFSYDRGEGHALRSAMDPRQFIAGILDSANDGFPSVAHPVLPTAALAMASLRRGGALLVLPGPTREEAMPVTLGYTRLALVDQPDNLAMRLANYRTYHREWMSGNPDFQVHGFLQYYYDDILAESRLVGRMTGIDGFVVMQRDGVLLGIGRKGAAATKTDVPISVIDSQTGEVKKTFANKAFSGMRHTASAVACANGGVGALALVLSQDGYFTVIGHAADGVVALTRLAHL